MYIPPEFSMEKPEEILAFMRQYNFAVMVSTLNGKLLATHLPFIIDYENDEDDKNNVHDSLVFSAHFAKANPQALHHKELENQEVMIIFSEPHAYISPTLYQSYPNVPTWNYVAVHVYGQVKILDDEQTLQLMEKTVAHFEPQKEKFWDNLPPNYRKKLLDELVAFKFYVTRVEATKKISQNKSQIDQNNIIASLEKNEDENARKIAEIMRNK